MNHLTQTHVSISFRAQLTNVIYFKTMEQKKKENWEGGNKGQIRQGIYKRKVTINETKAGSLRESIRIDKLR